MSLASEALCCALTAILEVLRNGSIALGRPSSLPGHHCRPGRAKAAFKMLAAVGAGPLARNLQLSLLMACGMASDHFWSCLRSILRSCDASLLPFLKPSVVLVEVRNVTGGSHKVALAEAAFKYAAVSPVATGQGDTPGAAAAPARSADDSDSGTAFRACLEHLWQSACCDLIRLEALSAPGYGCLALRIGRPLPPAVVMLVEVGLPVNAVQVCVAQERHALRIKSIPCLPPRCASLLEHLVATEYYETQNGSPVAHTA